MKTIDRIKEIVQAGSVYLFDLKNDIRHTSLTHDIKDNQEALLSSLVVAAHTIEKGLTMPHKHYPFGEAKAMEILQGCQAYVEQHYDTTQSRFVDIVGIMKEYRDLNVKWGG